MFRRTRLAVIGFIGMAVLQGCVSKIQLKDNLEFTEKDQKIQAIVGVYMDDATKDYVIEKKLMKFMLGKGLSENAEDSLGKVFLSVKVVDNSASAKSGIVKIAILSFGQKTEMKIPMTVFQDHVFNVEVACEIKDQSGNVIWKGSGFGTSTKNTSASFFLGGWVYKPTVRGGVKEAMEDALDNLNEEILKNKELIAR